MTDKQKVPGVWLVRAGKHGEDEEYALSQGLAVIGFREAGDLTQFASLEGLTEQLKQRMPSESPRRAENLARQLWAFKEGIHPGDTIVLPLKTRPGQIALGRAVGPYCYPKIHGENRHTRKVDWEKPDVPRSTFLQDLLYSFGAFMTVCRITRNDAEHRVAAVIAGNPDPGFSPAPAETAELPTAETQIGAGGGIDIAQAAHDEIISFVRSHYTGHELSRLIESILQAEGYLTHRSQPGPDGGADILAGKGPLGLDRPSLCVQVKATNEPADVTVFRALQGTMTTFNADQGLLVSWNGFKQAVKTEARQHIFKIRLWDQSDIVQAIYRNYERLPEEFQAELPLKRIWVLVREDVEES
jgi:restriction system protein